MALIKEIFSKAGVFILGIVFVKLGIELFGRIGNIVSFIPSFEIWWGVPTILASVFFAFIVGIAIVLVCVGVYFIMESVLGDMLNKIMDCLLANGNENDAEE